jgi:hypothetical protein
MVKDNYDYAQDLNQDPLGATDHGDPGAEDDWAGATPTELAEAETAEGNYGGSSQNRFAQKGTVIIMMACLLGVGAIYFFSFKNQPKEATEKEKEAEVKIDTALARIKSKEEQAKSQALFEKAQEMVETFYTYPAKQQIALKELRRDPFLLPYGTGGDDGEDLSVLRSRQKSELEAKLQHVKLQSIIQGPQGGKCLVNGEVYSAEDTLLKIFKIKEIGDENVILIANDFEFVLSM